jgi:hypothetical protein
MSCLHSDSGQPLTGVEAVEPFHLTIHLEPRYRCRTNFLAANVDNLGLRFGEGIFDTLVALALLADVNLGFAHFDSYTPSQHE